MQQASQMAQEGVHQQEAFRQSLVSPLDFDRHNSDPVISHVYDNRVLPNWVTEQNSPIASAMFHHPDVSRKYEARLHLTDIVLQTACNEQNLNSVITRPRHGERFALDDPSIWKQSYRVSGYAYEGGGVKIERVELSLDGGKTWLYAFRRYPDKPLRHGKRWWTWLHWHIDIPMKDLLTAKQLCCRAWNVYKNTQPEHITWNLVRPVPY